MFPSEKRMNIRATALVTTHPFFQLRTNGWRCALGFVLCILPHPYACQDS